MDSAAEGGVIDRARLKGQIKDLIVRACQVPDVRPEDIPDDAALFGGPGPLQLDSLDALEIAMALRREFGIEMEETSTNTEAFRSVDTLAEFVVGKANTGGARNLPLS